VRRGDGLEPADGADPAADWQGTVPADALPHVEDPPAGFIVSANQQVAGPGYDHYLGSLWSEPLRAARIKELLAARDRVDLDDLRAVQSDVQSGLARALLPLLVGAQIDSPSDRDALERLRAWDLVMAADSAAAAIFLAWYAQLLAALVEDELGPELYGVFADHRPRALVALLSSGSPLCDDVRTPARESCPEIAGRALTRAVEDLGRRLGPDPKRWRLDGLQRARFQSPVLGRLPLLGGLTSREVGMPGDPFTVHVAGWDYRDPYKVRSFSTLFYEAELGAAHTRFVYPLGQSANPLSAWYDDLLGLWARTELLELPASDPQHRLVLAPTAQTRELK
jgi:penicillin amidase